MKERKRKERRKEMNVKDEERRKRKETKRNKGTTAASLIGLSLYCMHMPFEVKQDLKHTNLFTEQLENET